MHCTNCKTEILATTKFCPECGNKVEPHVKTCPKPECKRSGLPAEAVFCPDCGTRIGNIPHPTPSKTVQEKPIFKSFTETTSGLNMEMIAVKGGTFTMGCTSEQGNDCYDSEKPAHKVTLSDYYIGKYPITQRQWREVMGNNPSHFSGCDNCPVEMVSWDDVQKFINNLNLKTNKKYCLPTEAQWEFAARGGIKSLSTKYSGSDVIENVAWFGYKSLRFSLLGLISDGNSKIKTHPVGNKNPNELGIYDMSGNVWEWCCDSHVLYSSDSRTNPPGYVGGILHVLRGGAFLEYPLQCRVSSRHFDRADARSKCIGFRLALVP